MSQNLSIIIVNYNTRAHLLNCINSIVNDPSCAQPEILVIDNASTDGSSQAVRDAFPQVTLINNNENIGYTRAVNQGIKLTTTEFILILNADILIKQGSIGALLEFMAQHPDAGIAGSKLLYPDGTLQASCRTFYTPATLIFRRTILGRLFPDSEILDQHLMRKWDHKSVRQVDWVLGGCMMVRREAIQNVGMLDERYFLYLEDVDWCYRMQQYGWRVYYVPDSEIIHYYRQGSRAENRFNKDVFIHILSMLRYFDKWNKFFYQAKQHFRTLTTLFLIVLDVCGNTAAFFLAYYLHSLFASPQVITYGHEIYYPLIVLNNVFFILIYHLQGNYSSARFNRWVDTLPSLVKSITLAFFLTVVSALLTKRYQYGFPYSRLIATQFFILSLCILTAIRLLLSEVSRLLHKNKLMMKRVLIVGYDDTARAVRDELNKAPSLGYEVAGFLWYTQPNGCCHIGDQVLGSIMDIETIIKAERIHEVIFVNLHKNLFSGLSSIIVCKKHSIDFSLLADEFEDNFWDPRIDYLVGFPVIAFQRKPMVSITHFLKRWIDILISGLGLIVCLPLFIFIALTRKNRKPLFRQEHVIGQNMKPFAMYTLGLEQPDETIAGEELDQDKKSKVATPPGKNFLNEIPQLINVLKGEMSIVGPRPVPCEKADQYALWHLCRFQVKPGITGLWQIHKQRKWKFDEMIKLDIFYIVNWSLSLDFHIILRTIPMIINSAPK